MTFNVHGYQKTCHHRWIWFCLRELNMKVSAPYYNLGLRQLGQQDLAPRPRHPLRRRWGLPQSLLTLLTLKEMLNVFICDSITAPDHLGHLSHPYSLKSHFFEHQHVFRTFIVTVSFKNHKYFKFAPFPALIINKSGKESYQWLLKITEFC